MYEILKKVSRDIIYHKTSLNKQIRPRMHVAMVIVFVNFLKICKLKFTILKVSEILEETIKITF